MAYDIAAQPAPSPAAQAFLNKAPRLFINGEWVNSSGGDTLAVIDPATGREIARIADATKADADKAVSAARAAFEDGAWPNMPLAKRERLIWRLAELVDANRDELAELESLDNGKTKKIAALVDVPNSADMFRHMAGWTTKIEGANIELAGDRGGRRFHTYTRREPVGVVAQIIPWNFPLLMAANKLAPALAAGCTIVLKPAEQTSLTALRLGELIQEAGFPAGVVNILTGRGEIVGAALVDHPGVDKIAFTGSTPVGKLIMRNGAESLKRVSLELGGKSPVIVFPDADLGRAISGASDAIFFNQGQVCTAGSRLYVHKDLFDQVLEGVAAAAQKIRLGPGLDPQTRMGPLVSDEQQARVLSYIESGKQEGAAVLTGGGAPSHPGYFVEPTVLVDVKPNMRVVREEIFGPVLAAQRFEDINDVAALANDTIYGLAASIWTRDVSTAHRLAAKVRAGTVWVNCHGPVDVAQPFGGFKQSGIGRENGRSAIDLYTETKTVLMEI